jgi:hypothetical protein
MVNGSEGNNFDWAQKNYWSEKKKKKKKKKKLLNLRRMWQRRIVGGSARALRHLPRALDGGGGRAYLITNRPPPHEVTVPQTPLADDKVCVPPITVPDTTTIGNSHISGSRSSGSRTSGGGSTGQQRRLSGGSNGKSNPDASGSDSVHAGGGTPPSTTRTPPSTQDNGGGGLGGGDVSAEVGPPNLRAEVGPPNLRAAGRLAAQPNPDGVTEPRFIPGGGGASRRRPRERFVAMVDGLLERAGLTTTNNVADDDGPAAPGALFRLPTMSSMAVSESLLSRSSADPMDSAAQRSPRRPRDLNDAGRLVRDAVFPHLAHSRWGRALSRTLKLGRCSDGNGYVIFFFPFFPLFLRGREVGA